MTYFSDFYKIGVDAFLAFCKESGYRTTINEGLWDWLTANGYTQNSLNDKISAAQADGFDFTSLGSTWTPAELFAASEVGAWYDPSDFSTMFQDSAGTTPVTAAGDPVGYIADKSGNGFHAVQATAANRPALVGTPTSYGSELAPALGASWTAGAGWTDAGVATASSASLTTAISLDVGSIYEFTYTVDATSGNVYPQFTGGTASQGVLTSVDRTITQFLRAETGNTTLSITGVSFTGTVSSISLKKVLTWAAPYGLYGQRNSQLLSATTLTVSMPAFICALFKSDEDVTGRSILVAGVAGASNNYIGIKQAAPSQRAMASSRTATGPTLQIAVSTNGEFAFPTIAFVSGSFSHGANIIRINGNTEVSTANTWDSGVTIADSKILIATEGNNGFALGTFYGGLVRFATTSAAERRSTMLHMLSAHSIKHLVTLGDSLTDHYPATGTYTPVGALIPGVICTLKSEAGDTIAAQKTKWLAMDSHTGEDIVVIQIGLNNLDPTTSTAAEVIAELQDLIDTVQSSTSAFVYVATMTPCKGYLMTYWGGTNGPLAYQKWLDINEAISGSGATPITNVDGRITSHTTSLNDGAGALDAAYDNGDGIHTNMAGRIVNAAAWKTKLTTDGVL